LIEVAESSNDADVAPLVSDLQRLHPGKNDAAPKSSTTAAPAESTTGEQGRAAVGDTTIRVDVVLLDNLMMRIRELVLARNQIVKHVNGRDASSLVSAVQWLDLITAELQEGVMKTRMLPIGNLWSKFPRVVRDLAAQLGKQVRLEMQGSETELDKTIVEAIKDPLTHLVRNSVDHGIEPPETRQAAGKPVEGRLLLRAFHEGGRVNIEVSDDGAGLNIQRILAKAVERGLISAEQSSRVSQRDAARFILLPGFSTAEKVTSVSGRGVGMDVVKTNIQRIGGMIEVHSRSGKGTTIRIKIPLTLPILPAPADISFPAAPFLEAPPDDSHGDTSCQAP
jgi:two-component system, chemotaxis family, sensor kinase CheA